MRYYYTQRGSTIIWETDKMSIEQIKELIGNDLLTIYHDNPDILGDVFIQDYMIRGK